MNKHEIISRVYDHLMTQGSKCTIPSGDCNYRNKYSTKACAIGALIDKVHYSLALEGNSIRAGNVVRALRLSGIEVDSGWESDDSRFLTTLQDVHDNSIPSQWEQQLFDLADKWKL